MEDKEYGIDLESTDLFSCQQSVSTNPASFMLSDDHGLHLGSQSSCPNLTLCDEDNIPSNDLLLGSSQSTESCLGAIRHTVIDTPANYSDDRVQQSLESYLSLLDTKCETNSQDNADAIEKINSSVATLPSSSMPCLQISNDNATTVLSNDSNSSCTVPARGGQVISLVIINGEPTTLVYPSNVTSIAFTPLNSAIEHPSVNVGKDSSNNLSCLLTDNKALPYLQSSTQLVPSSTLISQHDHNTSASDKAICETDGQPTTNKFVRPVTSFPARRVKVNNDDRPKTFACDLCDKRYFTSSHLKAHKRSHTGERPYACDLCSNTYCRPESLSAHRRIHMGIKRFVCSVCGKKYGYYSHLNVHIKRVHENSRPYECKECGKCFTMANNLRYHMKIHSKEKPHKCDICGRGFTYAADLQRHTRGHTGERNFICNLCGKAFAESGTLTRHKKHVHPQSTTNDSATSGCGVTEKTGDNSSSQDSLASLDMPAFINLSCSSCSETFTKEQELIEHLEMEHKPDSNSKFKCGHCPRTFENLRSARAHENRMHLLEEKQNDVYTCDICGVDYHTKKALMLHKSDHYTLDDNSTYTDTSSCQRQNGRYQCNLCSRQFQHQAGLVVHRFSHSKCKPYHCENCGQCFKTRRYLNNHQIKCKYNQIDCQNVDSSDNLVDSCEDTSTNCRYGDHLEIATTVSLPSA